jgi:hypothetical protein
VKNASLITLRTLKPVEADYLIIATTSLNNPADYAPSWHIGVESQLPWLDIHDDLPRMRTEEAPKVREAWESAGTDDSEDCHELEYEKASQIEKN